MTNDNNRFQSHSAQGQSQSLKQKKLEFLDTDFKGLEEDKIKARQKLLTLNPQEAQELANQTLMPQKWQLSPNQSLWVDSFPVDILPSGQTNSKE